MGGGLNDNELWESESVKIRSADVSTSDSLKQERRERTKLSVATLAKTAAESVLHGYANRLMDLFSCFTH